MNLVVVERDFPEPEEIDGLQAREDAVAWCLEERDVTFLRTYFSLDRRRMVCIYRAPDAESVRYTQRRAGLPVSAVWSAGSFREHFGSQPPTELGARVAVVVERAFPEVPTMEMMSELARRASWCLDAHAIELIDSYVATGQPTSFCVFAAPDAESVRTANRTTSSPYVRAWPATMHLA
jgi:hypothetical protein